MEKGITEYTPEQYNFVKDKILNKRKKPVHVSHKLIREIYRRNINKNRRNYNYARMVNRLMDDLCPYKFRSKIVLGPNSGIEYISKIDDKLDYFWAWDFRYFVKKSKKNEMSSFVFQISDKNIACLLCMTFPDIFQLLNEELEN